MSECACIRCRNGARRATWWSYLVVSTRGGKPQSYFLPRVKRSGGVRRRLSARETAFQIGTGRGLQAVGKGAALGSASIHLFCGAI